MQQKTKHYISMFPRFATFIKKKIGRYLTYIFIYLLIILNQEQKNE